MGVESVELFEGRSGNWAAVVVNYNAAVFLDSCFRTLLSGRRPPGEIVMVDNASSDDSLREMAGWPQVVVEASPVNLGFAGGANRGVALTEAPLVVVLNPDVELAPDFGVALLDLFERNPRLGAAGTKLHYPERPMIQHAGGVIDFPLLTTWHRGYGEEDRGQWDEPAAVDFVTGGAMALRRAAFDAVGGFDEAFFPAYYEDADLCFRLRAAGWQVRYEPALRGTHVESVGLGRSLAYYRSFHRSRLRFALKHLSQEQWSTQFIPAELERLRGELSAIQDADWPVTSGAEAIDSLARTGMTASDRAELLRGEPLLGATVTLDEVRWRATLPDEPRSGLRSWIRRRLNRISGRAFADDLYWRQRAFNEAVVRALEAQDRFNREVTAELLLALLDLGGQAGAAERGGAHRDGTSTDVPAVEGSCVSREWPKD